MKKRGWLIVNGFLKSAKFDEIYAILNQSATCKNIDLQVLSSCEIVAPVGDPFARSDRPDFVLFWDKDVHLAAAIESAGIPVFNSASAIYACDDKAQTAQRLVAAGVPHPTTIIAPKAFEVTGYSDLSFYYAARRILGLPMIIKECFGSFGAQVYLAETDEEAERIIKSIGAKPFIMQRFIAESRGRDVRVNVVGGKVIAGMERVNPSDFRSNVTGGGKARAYSPTDEEKSVALAACSALGTDFAGVDVLFGKDGAIVCEVNSNPHFRSTLDCTGVNLADYIIDYIAGKIK